MLYGPQAALLGAVVAVVAAQVPVPQVQDTAPAVVVLSTTKSGVLPTLPTATPFTGLDTLQGAIVKKAPADPNYTGLGGTIPVQSAMPVATYVATLPSVMYNPATGASISGTISGAGNANGGVTFQVAFANFPSAQQYGPFVYHIHDQPVPADGNCTSTLGHLDPTNRGEYIPCTPSKPETCQAGDLAGKHGKINGTSFTASFVDNYLSTDPQSAFFFGSKSIVLHTSNTTRLICANFKLAANGASTASSSATILVPTGSSSPTLIAVNAADRAGVGLAAAGLFVVGALAAFC